MSGTSYIDKNHVIDNIADLKSCYLDIATSNNNNPDDGANPALFADEAHPNSVGHKAIYERIKIDLELN